MKIVNLISVILLCVLDVSSAHSANQITLFNTWMALSWKSDPVNLSGYNVTIERHLAREFNAAAWAAGASSQKITPAIAGLTNMHGYYGLHTTVNPGGWPNNLATDDSPRAWMRNLNLREIIRFKDYVIANPNLINNANYATDDLVKARSLSGILWRVDITGHTHAASGFSGMLVPGQGFGLIEYQIYTCMHGFRHGNGTNNVAYYFVPYGVTVSSNPGDANYVCRKGFKVTHVRHFRNYPQEGENIDIDTAFFNAGSIHMNTAAIYSQRDYAVATVRGGTDTHESLKNILMGTALAFIKATDINLPVLNTAAGAPNSVNQAAAFNNADERLFIIGSASRPAAALNQGLAVSTNLTIQGPQNAPRRSFADDENTKTPANIQARPQEDYSSLPSYPGISGGPILRCRLDPNNPANKKCVIIGTNFGAERIFTAGNQLQEFGNIVNKIH